MANSATASDASAASAARKQWPLAVLPSRDVASTAPSGEHGPSGWSEAEIKEAKAHCAAVLKGVDAAFVDEDPIKQGECGSPVVFKLVSVGRAPVVEVSPPVLVTCDLIAGLDRWMKAEVQPKARTHLGGSIIKLETMSSYSCRNAYGRAKTRLSEHGKANAIDIAGFATAKTITTVLAGWGPTAREERAIAARLEAERAAQAQAQAQAQQNGVRAANTASAQSGPAGVSGLSSNIPGVIVSDPNSTFRGSMGFGFAPSRLGGPKAPELPSKPQVSDVMSKQKFLREIHASACRYFGTVLGPEANNAHRNHFHLDMAQRRSSFCE